jgi:hypothetical protein
MGVGNLSSAIEDFGAGPEVSYARLFFQSTPNSHARAWRRLQGLGDDSVTYYWRVQAAREIMAQYRSDPEALARKSELHTAKNSAEEVLHPPGETEVYDDPEELEQAYRDSELRPFPDAPAQPARWASWPDVSSSRDACTAGCARRPTRWLCTSLGSRATPAAGPRRSP